MPAECDKASRILRVFTLDRDHAPEQTNYVDEHAAKKQQKVIQRIPAAALAEAQGIAIFTVFRSGLGISGASGGGLVMARLESGEWGPPSGILMHTVGFGFLVGLDVYDVVILLRTKTAVESFCTPKFTLGGDLSIAAGPVGQSAVIDAGYKQAPAWSYVKSKGFYAGAQRTLILSKDVKLISVNGTIIIERQDENAKFYYRPYTAREILSGKPQMPHEAKGLIQTLRAAEGKSADHSLIPGGVAPSEVEAKGIAPPNYDDLDIINVKCSMCGAKMTPDMLTDHKCESTSETSAGPSAPPPSLPPRAQVAHSEPAALDPANQLPIQDLAIQTPATDAATHKDSSMAHLEDSSSRTAASGGNDMAIDRPNILATKAEEAATVSDDDRIELVDATASLGPAK
jgi:lipid-binding SYLF domain-containing protein